MHTAFEASFNPARILFGPGTSARVAEEISRQGRTRARVLSTPLQKADGLARTWPCRS